MKKKIFLFLIVPLLVIACGKKKETQVIKPKGNFNISTDDKSDREPNGGMLRFTLGGKTMHDKYFVAQFTPRGDIFEQDNLQLYNYNLGSDKYPQFIINLDFKESELNNWQNKVFPLHFLAFTAAPDTPPFNSQGELKIIKVTDTFVEGTFHGYLINPISKRKFPVKGEFKAIIKMNV